MSRVGRDHELRVVLEALAAADAGEATGILVEGQAGIGKSTILAAALEAAARDGWRLLTARAVPAEVGLALGVLADVLRPVPRDAVERLAAPQRQAVEAALFERDAGGPAGEPIEPRRLYTAVRNLLDALAEQRPTLLAIDDVQWADQPSMAAITYAARRLAGTRFALLLTRRSGLPLGFAPPDVFPEDRWTRLEVGPMTLASIHELLVGAGLPARSRATLVRIHQASGGNPLFALEIARAIGSGPDPRADEPLPVPADVRDLIGARIGRLDAELRSTLSTLALLGSATADRLSAIQERDVSGDLAEAASDGLVRWDGAEIRFAHPLFGAVAESTLSDRDRRDAHRLVAATAGSHEERVRHLALANSGPDAELAADLEVVASDVARRGAPLSAADLLRLAIDRTPMDDPLARAERRLRLASELRRGGEIQEAVSELEPLVAAEQQAVRVRARLELASIRYETEASSAAAVRLASAAVDDAVGDAALGAYAYSVLAAVNWEDLASQPRSVEEGLRLLATVPEPDPMIEGSLLARRCGADFAAGRELDAAIVERALELEAAKAAPVVADRFSASLGTWLKGMDRFDEARLWLQRTRQTALEEGDEGSLPYALSHIPELEVWAGRWGRAEEAAREHLALAKAVGLESQRDQALYNLALVHVHQGREAEARAEIVDAVAATESAGDDYLLSGVLPLLGLLELSRGDAAAAAPPLERAWAIRNALGSRSPWRPGPDLVEALLGVGDTGRAEAVQDEIERRLAGTQRLSLQAAARRSRGLLLAAGGDVSAACEVLLDALDLHSRATIALDRSRTLLALGRVRRRLRERSAARDAFVEAKEGFEALGARLWTALAAAELERTGIRRATAVLSETERRVAELAASGLTNREVAAALFISPKTVEANLARSYIKLGIESRAQLGVALAGTGATEHTAGNGGPVGSS